MRTYGYEMEMDKNKKISFTAQGGDTPVPAREEVVKRASPGSSFSDCGTFVAENQATLSFTATGQLEMERILDQRMREEKVLAFSRRESLKRTPPEKSKVEEAKNKEDTLDTPFKERNKKEWDVKPPSTEQTVEDITWTLIKTPEKMVKKRKCVDPSSQSTLFKVEPNLTISKLLQKVEKIVKFKNDNKSVHKEIKTGIMEILDLVNKGSKENVKEREEKELLENMLQKANDVLTKKHEELDAVKMENAEVRKKEKKTEQKIKRLELKYNEETKNNSEKIRRDALQEKINKRLEEKTDFQTFWELKDDLWPEECFNKTNMNSELRQNSINDTKVVMLNLKSWDIDNPDITKILRDKPILAEVAKARELDTGQTINVKNSSQIEIEGLDKETLRPVHATSSAPATAMNTPTSSRPTTPIAYSNNSSFVAYECVTGDANMQIEASTETINSMQNKALQTIEALTMEINILRDSIERSTSKKIKDCTETLLSLTSILNTRTIHDLFTKDNGQISIPTRDVGVQFNKLTYNRDIGTMTDTSDDIPEEVFCSACKTQMQKEEVFAINLKKLIDSRPNETQTMTLIDKHWPRQC
ncbi:hypothetical protein FQR65_LT15714 [Abscondita terminalis]|nr:hypothetical protein FQR65_LT15714 [Abscondita terminalis]